MFDFYFSSFLLYLSSSVSLGAPVSLPEEPKLRILLQVEVSFCHGNIYCLPPSHKFGTLDLFPFAHNVDKIAWQPSPCVGGKGRFVLDATFYLFIFFKRNKKNITKVKSHQKKKAQCLRNCRDNVTSGETIVFHMAVDWFSNSVLFRSKDFIGCIFIKTL